MAPVHAAPGSGTFWLRQYSSKNSPMRGSEALSSFSYAFHADSTIGLGRPSYGERIA